MLLAIAPWTLLWERNYFVAGWPWLAEALANRYIRGGVTGIGLVTLLAGMRDLAGAILGRHEARATALEEPGQPPGQPRG